VVRVESIQKSFLLSKKDAKVGGIKKITAVDNLSFQAEPGEVLALLGSNGAGKTTTLRLLSTALEVDTGEIWFGDVPVHQYPRRARNNIGFLSNATPLYRRMTVRENLVFFGQLYEMHQPILNQRIEALSIELGFEDYLDKKVDSLSTGMNQKASIVRSILHDPAVIILDEPTTGLDVEASQQILNFIFAQKKSGKTIIFSTHHMNEVELLADRICLIHKGKNRFTGTVEQAKTESGYNNLTQAFLGLLDKEIA
jgi:sodium transport system ATP-binding protein